MDDDLPTPEAAMTWPYLVVPALIFAIVLGSLAAFAIENWPLILLAVGDFLP